jgi:type II secretory ATPase GspE/PulE/Tfp pilus assembly ATPase PilB-like protein
MTGYLGQTGIYELLTVDDAVYEMIIAGAPETQIRDYIRRQGYKPLFEAGLEKVRSGQISLEELLRVITIGETYLATPERVASFHA